MVSAFVLVSVPAQKSGEVVEALRQYPQVQEAAAVFGDVDVVAKVQARSFADLDRLVMQVIQGKEIIKATRTYIIIESLHWQR